MKRIQNSGGFKGGGLLGAAAPTPPPLLASEYFLSKSRFHAKMRIVHFAHLTHFLPPSLRPPPLSKFLDPPMIQNDVRYDVTRDAKS